MRKMNMCKCVIACVLTLLLACPFTAMAQQAVNVEWWFPANQSFRPEELDQMLAPIALYPDQLLAQVLAAATYPHSIASADRFVKDNPRVPGQVLIDVARDTDWSPSVKAMLLFPDVLAMMAQHLDWTTNLGEAFLAQQRDVMDSVQYLRHMAYQQRRLTTMRELVVRFDTQTDTIFIEPADPQMIYVPVYDSEVVYGTWRHPDYPPYRYYYPGHSNSSAFSFLAGVLVGAGLGWGGWDFDWSHHRSNVHVGNYNTFVSRSYASPDRYQISSAGGATVAYDTQFRKNAGYRDYETAQRFSGRQVSGTTTTEPRISRVREAQQVQARPSTSTVGTASVRTEKSQASKTNFKVRAKTPRPVVNSSMTDAGRSKESPSNVVVSNTGEVSKGFSGASKGSEASQAAHAAQSEGLKGKDLAGKVHEAIDTRKENKDASGAEAKANDGMKDEVKASDDIKDETKAKEKDVTEKVKKEKEPKEKGAKEKRQ